MQSAVAYIRVVVHDRVDPVSGWEGSKPPPRSLPRPAAIGLRKIFSEVETGKGADALSRRPKLAAAIAQGWERRSQQGGADDCCEARRLSRDVHSLSGLMRQNSIYPHRVGARRSSVHVARLRRGAIQLVGNYRSTIREGQPLGRPSRRI
jgi:hypothetical protein